MYQIKKRSRKKTNNKPIVSVLYKFWVCTCNSNDKIVTSENIFLLNLILSLSGATPLSNAEKQRRYRERLNKDPDRKREYLEKKKQNTKMILKLESGKGYPILQIGRREQSERNREKKSRNSERNRKAV